MSDDKVYPVPAQPRRKPLLDADQYYALHRQSIEDPEGFWATQAKQFLSWDKPWDQVLEWDYHKAHIRWFEGGRLNVSANCLDRHLKTRGEQTAILWEGDDPGDVRRISYKELHAEVCRLGNLLKKRGVKKGDRVCIYMPMVPEAAMAMLACARIGAVHSVLVLKRTAGNIEWDSERDIWYHETVPEQSKDCPAESMGAEDPLFILYTSGSTGKPKGVLHTCGGYLLYAAITHKYVFDYQEGDIYWCTADVGWVTGHSYIVYGPLA